MEAFFSAEPKGGGGRNREGHFHLILHPVIDQRYGVLQSTSGNHLYCPVVVSLPMPKSPAEEVHEAANH